MRHEYSWCIREDPNKIRYQILEACPKGQEIAGRAYAIASAIKDLEENDLLLIAGKGHEATQIIGDQVLPFSDIDVTKKILVELASWHQFFGYLKKPKLQQMAS